jgi:hypothetical protein
VLSLTTSSRHSTQHTAYSTQEVAGSRQQTAGRQAAGSREEKRPNPNLHNTLPIDPNIRRTCAHTRIHAHTHLHTRTYTHTYTHKQTHTHTHTHAPIRMEKKKHTHTHSHTNTHTLTHLDKSTLPSLYNWLQASSVTSRGVSVGRRKYSRQQIAGAIVAKATCRRQEQI